MARIRSIKVDLFLDEKLGRCSPGARLLFVGMIANADDAGVCRAGVAYLRSTIYPYDQDPNLPYLLSELSREGIISQIEESGEHYAHIRKFMRHQRLDSISAANRTFLLTQGAMTRHGIQWDASRANDDSSAGKAKLARPRGATSRRRRPAGDGGRDFREGGIGEGSGQEKESERSSETIGKGDETGRKQDATNNDTTDSAPTHGDEVIHKLIHNHPQPMWITWLLANDVEIESVVNALKKHVDRYGETRGVENVMIMSYFLQANREIKNHAAYWTRITDKPAISIRGDLRSIIRDLMRSDNIRVPKNAMIDEDQP